MTNLSRFEQFLAIPVEDIEERSKLALSEIEVVELHTLLVKGEVSKDFYYQITNALKADFIFRESGQNRGWTVSYIRQQLGRTAYWHYSRGGEDIHEWVSGRLWPKGSHIERIRSAKDPLCIVHEVELAFSPDADLEGLWRRQKAGFEQEGIELFQKFPDNKFVQDMCFLSGDQNLRARIVISAGSRRKELMLPIALRYEPILKKMATKYKLDVTEWPSHHRSEPLQRASTDELQEVLAGLWAAVRNYDPSKDIPIPAYIKKQLAWHMGDKFKRGSSEIEIDETGTAKRLLMGEIERTGGSLDHPLPGEEEEGASTLGDIIAAPQTEPLDQTILVQEILDALVDVTDKEIVHLMLQGLSQKEIGKKLKISQPAIAKRLKRLGKRLNH